MDAKPRESASQEDPLITSVTSAAEPVPGMPSVTIVASVKTISLFTIYIPLVNLVYMDMDPFFDSSGIPDFRRPSKNRVNTFGVQR